MTRWFTSDLHLGHANIITYCQRPFRDTDHMNTVILNTLNDHAGPDDELWLLGDIALGRLDDTLGLLRRLTAGRIVLIAGNHDRVHPVNTKNRAEHVDRWTRAYLDAGIDEIHPIDTRLTLNSTHPVTLNHLPPASTGTDHETHRADKLAAYRPGDDTWVLCGHVHEKWAQRGTVINVGIDAWAGRPLSETQLSNLISEGPRDRATDPWT